MKEIASGIQIFDLKNFTSLKSADSARFHAAQAQ